MLIMETTMDLIFLVDIAINFRTGYFIPSQDRVECVLARLVIPWRCSRCVT